MNIKQAIELRIPRISKPEWANSASYLRLPLLANGESGPWAELYDDGVQQDVLDIRPGSQTLLVFMPEVAYDDGYQEYNGQTSKYEAQNMAKSYAES